MGGGGEVGGWEEMGGDGRRWEEMGGDGRYKVEWSGVEWSGAEWCDGRGVEWMGEEWSGWERGYLRDGGALNLDLLVEQGELIVTTNELCTEDIAFVDDDVVLALLSEALSVSLRDDVIELIHL
jgi:hypothetical protein